MLKNKQIKLIQSYIQLMDIYQKEHKNKLFKSNITLEFLGNDIEIEYNNLIILDRQKIYKILSIINSLIFLSLVGSIWKSNPSFSKDRDVKRLFMKVF